MTTEDSEWADDDMTLAEHAEAWWREQGHTVPSDSEEWDKMYKQWCDFAFGPE